MDTTIQQLTIFLENRAGRLEEVLHILAEHKVNIVALSLADTSDFGLLRLIVSDPILGQAVLQQRGIVAKLTDVIAIRVPHQAGSLARAIKVIGDAEINIEYMYAFANGEDASAVLKADDLQKVVHHLYKQGFEVWSANEAYNLTSQRLIL